MYISKQTRWSRGMIVSFQLFGMKGEDCVFVTWLAPAKQFPKMELEIEKKVKQKILKSSFFD